jgi:hypothetical protein
MGITTTDELVKWRIDCLLRTSDGVYYAPWI